MTQLQLYPLSFEPIFEYRLWGGRRLGDWMNKPLPDGPIGEALVRVGAVSESDITETLSQQFGVPSIDLAHFDVELQLRRRPRDRRSRSGRSRCP